jgi:transcriptional regulator with XRE-family HTH domain
MIGERIRAWRSYRNLEQSALESVAKLAPGSLDAIESGREDPPASTLDALAQVFGIPSPWLFGEPRTLMALVDEEDADDRMLADVDPVTTDILRATDQQRDLFALLARVIHSGDSKLLRAAEVNLKSLIRQIPRTTVPWQTRPSGHFEPPSD